MDAGSAVPLGPSLWHDPTMTNRPSRPRLRAGIAVTAALAAFAAGCSGSNSGSKGTRSDRSTTTTAVPDAEVQLRTSGTRPAATVDQRFQSYNIEMVEVTGGEFWKPYDAGAGKVVRQPIDLSSTRLRNLARALGPAYIRVSGSWANSTYFDPDDTTGGVAPTGFGGVLTGAQWKGVGAFAKAVDGEVVTSFASSPGARDQSGAWRPDQAEELLRFSTANGVPVVAAELFNEPSLPIGFPAGYDAGAFARDFSTFTTMVRRVAPKLKVVGPGAVEDVTPIITEPTIHAPDMFAAAKGRFDVVSYHFYPKVSARCGSTEGPEVALTQAFLSRVEVDKAYYEQLRDADDPGAPMWVTETAQAACGGDRWASQYRDVIRYVDSLGRLATGDGDAVFHNTLAASDYGLLDEDGFVPRPDYWAAVLWRRLMGPKVLAVPNHHPVEDLSVYAHCDASGRNGGVTFAVVNASSTTARTVATRSGRAEVHLLGSTSLDSSAISSNGTVLAAANDGSLPDLPAATARGAITVPPAGVAFVSDPTPDPACR